MTTLNKVQVVRYIRPVVFDTNTGKSSPNNLGGVTFVFTMDYIARTIAIQYAVCSDTENFDKDQGKEFALQSEVMVYDLGKFRELADQFGGFAKATITIFRTSILTGEISRRARKLLQQVDTYGDQY